MRRVCALFLAVFAFAAGVCASVFAADAVFGWRQCAGQSVRVLLNKDHYAKAIEHRIGEFEHLSGVSVVFAAYPGESYFSRLAAAFGSPFGRPDVYVTNGRQARRQSVDGEMLPLDDFLESSSLTRRNYDIDDFFPRVIDAFRRDSVLWAVPVGFEGSAAVDGGNLAVWGLAVSPFSVNREAAWLFVQYFTGQDFQNAAAREGDLPRPPRRSVAVANTAVSR